MHFSGLVDGVVTLLGGLGAFDVDELSMLTVEDGVRHQMLLAPEGRGGLRTALMLISKFLSSFW